MFGFLVRLLSCTIAAVVIAEVNILFLRWLFNDTVAFIVGTVLGLLLGFAAAAVAREWNERAGNL